MSENNYVNLVIEKSIQKMLDRIEAGRKALGKNPGRETVSPAMQLKAYEQLTEADKVQLLQQKGPAKFAEYVMENEARLRRRGNNGIQNTG